MHLSLLLDYKLLEGGDFIYFNFISFSGLNIMFGTVGPRETPLH